MNKGNPNIGKHAAQGGKQVAKKYGSKHMSKIGKAGRKKQLQALKPLRDR